MTIYKRFKETIEKYGLVRKSDKILIAYSGGADSTALLALLLELQKEHPCTLALAHLNHMLRKSASEDEDFVRSMAQKNSLPLYVGHENVRLYAREHKLNVEEAGRVLRYEFLKRTASKIGATKVATAHTMTDQAETFLIRLMRGSGPQGLGGISPMVDGLLIRPLIEIERVEIEKYLRRRKLPFRVDETNLDRHFLRNRIRLDLIPYLQKNFEPGVVAQLSRAASILREEDEYLEKITRRQTPKAIQEKEGQLLLDANFFSKLHPALTRRVARHFIAGVKGDLRGISFNDIESVRNLGESQEFSLKGGLLLRREKGLIWPQKKALPKVEYEHTWAGDKILAIREVHIQFRGKILKRKSFPLKFDDEIRAYLEFEKLTFPLVVRCRREGDRYQALGAPGRKKLKEIMRAKGILLEERDLRPVFLSRGEIIWVVGLPVAEKFKVDSETKKIFVIEKL